MSLICGLGTLGGGRHGGGQTRSGALSGKTGPAPEQGHKKNSALGPAWLGFREAAELGGGLNANPSIRAASMAVEVGWLALPVLPLTQTVS